MAAYDCKIIWRATAGGSGPHGDHREVVSVTEDTGPAGGVKVILRQEIK